jgi:uncharacterized membrane protein YphA (DoxX/SURF4 family)
MIIDSRRIFGGFAIFTLVLLRLVIGWHFFGEGTKKLEYDRHTGRFHMVFSAEKEFLDLAKGPLAPLYLEHTPSEHEWRTALALPRENTPATPEQVAEQTKWAHEYAQRRAEAAKNGQPAPVEFAAGTASHDWVAKIADDWRAAVGKFKAISGLTEDQKQRADKALNARLSELADFIAGEEEEIASYRHELWRLDQWRKSPEENGVPFYAQRIGAKNSETNAKAAGWREQIRTFDDELNHDLTGILTPEQRAQPATLAAVEGATVDKNQHNLDTVNLVATVVTIGVGVCLIFGFLTRLAAIVGALFLFGVIASQPFWISGTAPTMNQCVELAALLVLAGTGAGRWAGMDGCLAALFGRRRVVTVIEE